MTIIHQLLQTFTFHLFFRFTTIYEANFVLCMRMTASLTSLSVSGMDQTGKDLFVIHPCTHPCIYPWCLYNPSLCSAPLCSPLSVIMTGSYNNFFRMFDRNTKRDVTLEASRENSKPRAILKPRKVRHCSSTQVTWHLEALCVFHVSLTVRNTFGATRWLKICIFKYPDDTE